MKIRNLAPLFSTLFLICAVALLATWYGSREFKQSLLEREAISDAVRWAEFVASQSPEINAELGLGRVSKQTRDTLELASRAGGIFRYKFFSPDGVIVHASRPGDVGKRNTKPYFEELVRKGETFAKIATDQEFGVDRSVVSEAYVPIMENGRFQGAVEVYVDATDTAARLDQIARYAFWGVTVLMIVVATSWSFFVWRDIKIRISQEKILSGKKEHFNAALDNMSQGLCMFDGEQRLIVCNERYASIYGLSAEQVKIGTTLREILEYRIANGFYAGANPEAYIQERMEWVVSGTRSSKIQELSDERAIAIVYQPMSNGGWLTTHEDVTERIRAEKALQESEKQFRNLVEGSIQGVFIHLNWKLLFANSALAGIFGYVSPEDLLSLGNIRPLLAPDEHDRLWGYKTARQKGEPVPDVYEVKGVRKDGSTIWAEFRSILIDWQGAMAMQCVVIDITDRKKAESELIRHRDHLQELVDTATMELKANAEVLKEALAKEQELNELQRQFVSMASHEFRTPLAIIDGVAQRMKRRAGKNQLTPEDAVQRVEKIRSAVRRMTRLMESTLTAARMQEGKIKVEIGPCDITKVVNDVCARQREVAGSHTISCHFTDIPETIQADTGSLEQVLTNLLANAVKYSPDAPDIDVTVRREGHHVVISVSDHGIGIDEDDLRRIGERFFRARTSTGIAGTCIGLNLVKTLVEEHGGTLGVESRNGDGSIFTIRLPIAGPDHCERAASRVA